MLTLMQFWSTKLMCSTQQRCSRDCIFALQEDDVDPLDAFMDAAVNPEVAAAEKAEAARKEALRTEQVKALAVRVVTSDKSRNQAHPVLLCSKTIFIASI